MLFLALLTACLNAPPPFDDEDEDGIPDALDCDDLGPDATEARSWWPDRDGDNYGSPAASLVACAAPAGYVTNADDCNDDDASVSPAEVERCDGEDTNCDGTLGADELDADGDGFTSCEGDCDDDDDARYPEAQERCDGVDDDCDGDTAPEELDADGDGFTSCEGDCDDSTPAASPGNTEEICRDNVDNDCSGVATECELPEAFGPGEARTALVTADNAYDGLGSSLSLVGDVDGDGFGDVGVGASGDDSAGLDAGALWLLTTPPPAAGTISAAATLRITGAAAGDQLGLAAPLGDLDGDGLDDLAVAAPGADSGRGVAYVAHGDELVGTSLSAASLPTRWHTALDGAQLGSAMTTWRNTVAVGAPGVSAVYVAPRPVAGQDADIDAIADRWVGPPGQQAGYSIAKLGDFDGDGLDDLAIGGPALDDPSLPGRVWVVLSAPVGDVSLAQADLVLTGVNPGDLAGYSVASAGDVTGDGLDDLLVGAPGANGAAGVVYLVRGRAVTAPSTASLATASLASWSGLQAGDRLGASVAGAGDLDHDGSMDLALGAPGSDDNGPDAGAVWLHSSPFLGARPVSTAAESHISGAFARSFLGSKVTATNDFDRDGYDDLIIAIPDSSASSAWFVWGTAL